VGLSHELGRHPHPQGHGCIPIWHNINVMGEAKDHVGHDWTQSAAVVES